MMKGVIIVVALLFGVALCHPLKKLLPLKAPCSVSNCGGDSKIKNLDVKLEPDPPKTGNKLSVTITGELEEEVTGGEVKLTVKLGFITVQTYEYEVCEIVTGGCPVQGAFVASASEEISGSTPKLKYNLELRGTDQSGGELLCINAECTFE